LSTDVWYATFHDNVEGEVLNLSKVDTFENLEFHKKKQPKQQSHYKITQDAKGKRHLFMNYKANPIPKNNYLYDLYNKQQPKTPKLPSKTQFLKSAEESTILDKNIFDERKKFLGMKDGNNENKKNKSKIKIKENKEHKLYHTLYNIIDKTDVDTVLCKNII